MPNEVKLLPCPFCGGKRTVPDVKPGIDPIRAYPEEMPCPECTDGTWAYTRPTIVTDEVVEWESIAKAIWVAEGHGAETMYQHNEHETWPVDRRNEYVGLDGEPRVMLMHYGWRKREKQARAALAAMPAIVGGE